MSDRSRRSRSGSRFDVLPIEGEDDSGSDSSVNSIRSGMLGSSSSSAAEMTMPSDYRPKLGAPPIARAQPGAGTSGTQTSLQRRIFESSQQRPTEDPSGLEFTWDHYRRESQQFEDVGVGAMFGETSQTDTGISKNIAEDVKTLADIGFIIEYPEGILGRGFYGTGYYGTNVSLT